MSRKRPTAVLVIAIFHFLFATCGVCGVGATQAGGMLKQLGGPAQGKANAKMEQFQKRLQEALDQSPGQQVLQQINLGVGLLMSAALIVAGIGLLQMRPWARWLSIAYAVVALLSVASSVLVYLALTKPALDTAWPDLERIDPNMTRLFQLIFGLSPVIGPLLGGIYPVAVLIVMLLPSVGKAFRATPRRGDEEDEDQEDYYDDKYER
jgi:hypothetical protein